MKTATLYNGLRVLAHTNGKPKQFANVTQAERAKDEAGDPDAYVRCRRPFYVVVPIRAEVTS